VVRRWTAAAKLSLAPSSIPLRELIQQFTGVRDQLTAVIGVLPRRSHDVDGPR
jgi:hypothetical protein